MSRLDNFDEILKSYEGRDSEVTVLFKGIPLLKRDYDVLEAVCKPMGIKPDDFNINTDKKGIGINDKRIVKLWLHNPFLSCLAPEIGELDGLQNFAYTCTNLSKLPESIGLLKNLTRLYLNDNQLDCLPESMKNLRKITCIGISNNYFESIPDVLLELPGLIYLDCRNNPMNYEKEIALKILVAQGVEIDYK